MLLDRDGLLEGDGVTKRARWFTLEKAEDLQDAKLAEFARAAADLATLGR